MNVCRCGPNPDSTWFKTAESLPAEWDEGLPSAHFLRRDSLKIHEGTQLPSVRTIYVLWIQQGLILARAAFQILDVKDEHIRAENLPGWQSRAWKLFRSTLK